MKFRQHIRVFGYPDALKTRIVFKRTTCLVVEGIGELDLHSKQKTEKLKTLLDKHKVKYSPAKDKERVRIRYLGKDKNVQKAIRGRMYKGDLLYTIEANDERELLDKRDEVLQELRELKVPYEDVCKWVCETAPKVPAKKMFKQKPTKTPDEIGKLKNKVEDLQDTIDSIERINIKRSVDAERKTREGVLT